jgi:hypothetical protein
MSHCWAPRASLLRPTASFVSSGHPYTMANVSIESSHAWASRGFSDPTNEHNCPSKVGRSCREPCCCFSRASHNRWIACSVISLWDQSTWVYPTSEYNVEDAAYLFRIGDLPGEFLNEMSNGGGEFIYTGQRRDAQGHWRNDQSRSIPKGHEVQESHTATIKMPHTRRSHSHEDTSEITYIFLSAFWFCSTERKGKNGEYTRTYKIQLVKNIGSRRRLGGATKIPGTNH